jgi:hypothetical protein
MRSILKNWWNGGSGGASAPGRFKPRNEYRANLIPALHAEHQELLALFGALERAAKASDEVACRTALNAFTRLLQQHLLAENRLLYGYFSHHVDANPKLEQRIEILSAEMLQIGKSLHRFVATYVKAPWSGSVRERLLREIPAIGSMLNHRIHEEEAELYPLYLQRAS